VQGVRRAAIEDYTTRICDIFWQCKSQKLPHI
jgi:hypothetical protein